MFTKASFAVHALHSKNQFFISFTEIPKSPQLLEAKVIEESLNKDLNLRQYGQLKQLGITMAISPKQGEVQLNKWVYNVENKSIHIQTHIPFKLIRGASKKQYLYLISAYYLASIAICLQLEIPAFNTMLLLKDMTNLFKHKGWINKNTISLNNEALHLCWVYGFKGGPQFYFNKMVHPEAIHYLESEAIAAVLEANISLADYGKGLKNIYFTFIADDPEDKMEGALIDYNAEQQYVETSLPLSYPGLLLMSKQYNRSLLALLFLSAMQFYEKVGLIDFDLVAFHRDVKALFWAEGWLDEALK